MMVLEFIILLGYDGQLEQSDMEKELFISAINQMKERSETIFFCYRMSFLDFKSALLCISSISAVRPWK